MNGSLTQTQNQWVERLTEPWQIQYLCHLPFFSFNCDTASQRTIPEGFSVGSTHATLAVNQLLSEELYRLSSLQIGWKEGKGSLGKKNDLPHISQEVRMRSRKGSQASCLLALLLSLILHCLSHCPSQGTQQIHIRKLYFLNYQLWDKSRSLYHTSWVFSTGPS